MVGSFSRDLDRAGEGVVGPALHFNSGPAGKHDCCRPGRPAEYCPERDACSGWNRDLRRVLELLLAEAGVGREDLSLVDPFDERAIDDRQAEDFGATAGRFDEVFRIVLEVEELILKILRLASRLHRLAGPLVIARTGAAVIKCHLSGGKIYQAGDDSLVGAACDPTALRLDLDPQGVRSRDAARRRDKFGDADSDLARAVEDDADKAEKGGDCRCRPTQDSLLRNDEIPVDPGGMLVCIIEQSVDDRSLRGGDGPVIQLFQRFDGGHEAVVDPRNTLLD